MDCRSKYSTGQQLSTAGQQQRRNPESLDNAAKSTGQHYFNINNIIWRVIIGVLVFTYNNFKSGVFGVEVLTFLQQQGL